MDLDGMWELFWATGQPVFYLMARREERTEESKSA